MKQHRGTNIQALYSKKLDYYVYYFNFLCHCGLLGLITFKCASQFPTITFSSDTKCGIPYRMTV